MCTCQIIDCLKAKKKRMYPLSILMRKCFNIVSLCVACPGDECRETGRSASPAAPWKAERLSRIGPVISLFLSFFFPLPFLLALYRRRTRPGSNTLTFALRVSEYAWRTHGWDSNDSLIGDNSGVTGKGLGEFAGVFTRRCISWNRMWQKCSWRAALSVEVHFEQYPNMLTCSFIHFKRNITGSSHKMNCRLTGCRRPRATKGYISPLKAVNTLRRSQWQRLCYPFFDRSICKHFQRPPFSQLLHSASDSEIIKPPALTENPGPAAIMIPDTNDSTTLCYSWG